jgi:hypothetical protein
MTTTQCLVILYEFVFITIAYYKLMTIQCDLHFCLFHRFQIMSSAYIVTIMCFFFGYTDNYHWIGIRGSGSNFFWSSSGSIVNFTDWTSPPTWAPGHNFDNHCVEMVQINGWSWSYIKCNGSQPFVCERPIN